MLILSVQLLLLSHTAGSVLLGWVESPGYPNGYSPYASLNWSRCAPKGHTLSIRLIHLDLEESQGCENDAVKIYSNGNLISVLCGKRDYEYLQSTENPTLVSAPGGCLSLKFHSDFSNTRRHTGFRGFYAVQDFDDCLDNPDNGCTQFCHNVIGGYHCSCRHGYHLDTDRHTCTVSCSEDLSGLKTGNISSPSWPSSYAENAKCRYSLSVEAHLQLELHFSEDFDVEQGPDGQCIDAVTIKTQSGTLGPFCGSVPPRSAVLTHSNSIHILFNSDGFGNNKGFTLHFKTRAKTCPEVVTSHSSVAPQQPEYRHGQKVTVNCNLGHAADIRREGSQTQYETTCGSTGIWSPIYPCEPVDCGAPVIPENGILRLVGSRNYRSQYEDQIRFECSSKYYTLEGDDTFTCSARGEWESSSGGTDMPKCIEVCGKPEKLNDLVQRILGGQDAKLGEIPWHLLIKEPRRGGASLISDRWAVTAAHVVEQVEETSLVLYGGVTDGRAADVASRMYDRANVVILQSEKIIIHPGYERTLNDRTNFDNDIALIRFASRVNFGPNLLPICLPESNMGLLEGEQGTVSGWGMTERAVSPKLKYTSIGVHPENQCENTPSLSASKRMIYTVNMFCAGAPGRDSCEKDSGGPFVVPMLSGRGGPYRLAGIVSWGPPCRRTEYKGYYTKVANYVDWIKETIERTEQSLV